MIAFIDTYRDQFGVELMPRPAGDRGISHVAGYRSRPPIRYEILITELRTMYEQNFSVYGHQEDARRDAPARLAAGPSRPINAAGGIEGVQHQPLGTQHWREPLQQQASEPVARHHAAAAPIGRRGLGLAIRRRPRTPRQRTSTGTPPARPDQPSTTPRRCRSSTHTPTRGAGPPENTHRQRPTPFGPHRILLLSKERSQPNRSAGDRDRVEYVGEHIDADTRAGRDAEMAVFEHERRGQVRRVVAVRCRRVTGQREAG